MARSRFAPNGPRSLQGAASRLPIESASAIRRVIRPPAEWQAEAWEFFDSVPELKFAGWWAGNAVGKIRLYAGLIPDNDPTGMPVPVDAVDDDTGQPLIPPALAEAAKAEVARLGGALGGQSEIQREAAINLDFTGECYLVGWGAYTTTEVDKTTNAQVVVEHPETWEVRSTDEVVVKDGKVTVKAGPNDNNPKPLDPERDTIIRIWQRHPRWSNMADCHLRGLLGECRALQILSQQIIAESMSRHSAGMLLISNEIAWGNARNDQTRTETGESGDNEDDPFVRDLTTALTEPISDPSHPSSVVPMVVRVPGEQLDKVKHIHFGREANEVIDRRIAARIERLARGINLPVEVVMGHMSTTFANAEQIDEDTFVDYVEPRVLLQVDAYTRAFLRPNLAESFPGLDPALLNRIVVWYDASALVAEPDRGEAADAAYDRNEISGAAYRAARGFTNADAPTETELMLRAALRRGGIPPEITKWLLEQGLGITIPVEISTESGSPTPGPDPGTTLASGYQAAQAAYMLTAAAQQAGAMRALATLLGFDLTPPAIDVGGTDPPLTPRS